ncbi:hypothetical protein [Terrabacter sp. NPDC000476]|uniref:hypothetical protein n=1 Tax=Terrabacter sp. NPDC000476 TaxID=3154258 RepID=UPI00331CF52A
MVVGHVTHLVHARRTGTAALLLAGAVAACAGCDAAPPPGPVCPGPAVVTPGDRTSSHTATPVRHEDPPALSKELVGSWETQHWLDPSGSRAIVRTYTFTPDGRYEYRLARCESSTSCVLEGSEQGVVRAAGGVLSLVPEPDSDEGPRSFPYAVGHDPNVGDVQLHLRLPTGEDVVFHAG